MCIPGTSHSQLLGAAVREGEGRGGGDKCECVKVHPCICVCNEGDSLWINVIAHTPYSSHGLLWGRRGVGEGEGRIKG